MQLSKTIKLILTREQRTMLLSVMAEYIRTVNSLVEVSHSGTSIQKYTSANVSANLPSAMKNQCIRDAKSILRKHNKALKASEKENRFRILRCEKPKPEPKIPVLRKLCCYINNQNFSISEHSIEFPVMISGKSRRISVAAEITGEQWNTLKDAKLGTLRVVVKNGKMVANIAYEFREKDVLSSRNTMGVDLGIKCPAVSHISDGSVKFYGNGRRNKYLRRRFDARRRKLQKAKHRSAIKKTRNKEQRIMKDIDHKLSREIVNTAIAHNVSVIKLERLSNIRSATRKSRKNNHGLHNWSFYRLASFIEYKAKMAGITVRYVNPAYTSQKCPMCGKRSHAQDRNYFCSCGFHCHRDLVGAMNIEVSTECVGGSNARRAA